MSMGPDESTLSCEPCASIPDAMTLVGILEGGCDAR